MAFGLHYTVFASANETGKGPALSMASRSVGGTSEQTAVMDSTAGNRPRSVRVCVDTNCWVTWGENPTALTDGTDGVPMGIDTSTVEYFDIPANHKIAVIQRT